jgi:hypothetical protein
MKHSRDRNLRSHHLMETIYSLDNSNGTENKHYSLHTEYLNMLLLDTRAPLVILNAYFEVTISP